MDRMRPLTPDFASHRERVCLDKSRESEQVVESSLLKVEGVVKSLSTENIADHEVSSGRKIGKRSVEQVLPGLTNEQAGPSIIVTSPGNNRLVKGGLADSTVKKGSLLQPGNPDSGEQVNEFLRCRSSLRRTSLPPRLPVGEKPIKEVALPGTFPRICGLENVLKDPRQGIPGKHLEGLSKTARWNLCVASIRPVARVATTPILANERSKSLDYKEKTSEWGPHAAYPPLDQSLSKLFDAPSDVIRKYQDSADRKSHLASQLSLTRERINELQDMTLPNTDVHLLENIHWFRNGNFSCTARPAAGFQPHFFMGNANPEGTFDIEILTSAGYKPMMIFRIVADYDLGFLYTPMSRTDLAGIDKPAIPQISPDTVKERIAVYEARMERRRASSPSERFSENLSRNFSTSVQRLQAGVESLDVFLKPMDKKLGNLTPRHQMILKYFNNAVGRTDKWNPMFHHGPDNLNPASDPASNYPLTVIVPFDLGVLKDRYYMIENDDELTFVLQVLKNHGYHAPVNPAWTIDKVVKAEFSKIKELTHSEWVSPLMKTKRLNST